MKHCFLPCAATVTIVSAAAGGAAGCTPLNEQTGTIPRGSLINAVQAEFGMPDVIADESGDQKRFYTPQRRPEEEWPPDAPRTFYYLDRNLEVVFVRARASLVRRIRPARRQQLESLVERAGGSGARNGG